MPKSKNLFFQDLLDEKEPTKLKPRDELIRIVEEKLGANVLPSSSSSSSSSGVTRIVSLCGSGATACTLAATLIDIGMDPTKVFIYDGSWCEWGADPDNPVVKND